MTEFVFGGCRLEADVEATRDWYGAYGAAAGGCECAYCRNFLAALEAIPPEAKALLGRLGLDAARPGEVMELYPKEEGRHAYLILYHVVGRLLAGEDAELGAAPACLISFKRDTGPFLRGFPAPCFQVLLSLDLPWLLEEPDPANPDRQIFVTGEHDHERAI